MPAGVDIINEFMVTLGFEVDLRSFMGFKRAIQEAQRFLEASTNNMAARFLKWEVGIVGAFGAISTAIVAFADHVSQADLSTRLFATRNFLTVESARKVQMAVKLLGHSIEEISWNKELREQMREFNRLADRWVALNPQVEENLKGLRAIHNSVLDVVYAIQLLGLTLASSLFGKLKPVLDPIAARLRNFAAYIVQNSPYIANWIANRLIPILKVTWSLVRNIVDLLKETAVVFTNLVGLMTGDKSLMGPTYSTENFTKAISKMIEEIGQAVIAVTQLEKAIVSMMKAFVLFNEGDFSGAYRAMREAAFGANQPAPPLISGPGGLKIGPYQKPDWMPQWMGRVLGWPFGTTDSAEDMPEAMGGAAPRTGLGMNQPLGRPPAPGDIGAIAIGIAEEVGRRTGIDPKFIYEQMAVETGNFRSKLMVGEHNLAGIMINMKKGTKPTAKTLRKFSDWESFVDVYAQFLKNRRYAKNKPEQAKNELDWANRISDWYGEYDAQGRRLPKTDPKEYARQLQGFAAGYEHHYQMAHPSGAINIDQSAEIHVHIQNPRPSLDEIQKGLLDAIRMENRRRMAMDLMLLNQGY